MNRQLEYIEIVKKLDSGGAANLYLGINLNTGRQVAVKELKDFLFKDPFTREKFREEANRLLDLEHPNIVQLEDLILYPDKGYMVMEFIDGRNLRDYMRSVTGPVPYHNAALFVSETLNALGFAHQNGVIHMDIKPSNIMLSSSNQIKLIDFGISYKADKVSQGKSMGTPYYMSPEQIDWRDIDHRSDIYSLGITLYELVTGTVPFKSEGNTEELLRTIKKEPVEPVKALNDYDRKLETEMNDIIRKAVSKNPDERYQDCTEFRDALKRIIDKM